MGEAWLWGCRGCDGAVVECVVIISICKERNKGRKL
jgi:hypothetical protein